MAATVAYPGAEPAVASTTPTLAQIVGQKLVVAMSGTSPDQALLARIQQGEVGGVILFGSNMTTASALRALTAKLQTAAAAGGQPRLLIATDQEGGSVRRVPWAPPILSPPQMGQLGSAATAAAQGRSTGYVLRCAGINGDLAPVADVPVSTDSFMYQQRRTWSFDAGLTASLSDAFATGLESGGSVPAMKHFPGIGLAAENTDSHVVTITASKAALAAGLEPYQEAIGHGVPLIMLSNATYTAYDSANAAGWSTAISVDLLRTTLGFTGVTITDSLNGTAAARGASVSSLAVKAAQADTDMIMLTGSETSSASTYASLLAAAQDGTIPLATLQASYDRIVALKSSLKDAVADSTPPTLTTPAAGLVANSTLGTTTVPVRASWSATDPCAISGYSLERRVNGGSWAAQRLSTETTTATTQSLAMGSTYRYTVRATDSAGNMSGWAYGETVAPYVRQSTSPLVTYSSGWRTASGSGYSGGSTRYAVSTGAWASYTFTGIGIGWVAAVGPTRGSAKVYIDGTYQATVSLYSVTTGLRRIVYAKNWSTQGRHTIRIAVAGTSRHPRVDVDAFARLYRL
jgi:beta-N-acetylhexosaminidase